jgi:hypothetical protein
VHLPLLFQHEKLLLLVLVDDLDLGDGLALAAAANAEVITAAADAEVITAAAGKDPDSYVLTMDELTI